MITRTRKIQLIKKAIEYGIKAQQKKTSFFMCNALLSHLATREERILFSELNATEKLALFEIKRPKVVVSDYAWYSPYEYEKRFKLLRKALVILYIKRFFLGEY